MTVTTRIEEVRNEISQLAQSSATAQDLMRLMVKLLHERMLKYNWVGFYMLEPGAQPPVLVLGAFEGAMTPHTRIPLNQGICGAAASRSAWLGCQYSGVAQFFSGTTCSCAFSPVNIRGKKTRRETARPGYFG